VRVLVCGGRDFSQQTHEWSFLYKSLDEVRLTHGITHLIQGGARGADACARAWAIYNKVPFTEYPADWEKHGKGAGFIRNAQMLREGKPDLVVAFPGGRGTDMMCELALKAGVEVVRFYPDQPPSAL
jgi:SLOG family YspA-like protein